MYMGVRNRTETCSDAGVQYCCCIIPRQDVAHYLQQERQQRPAAYLAELQRLGLHLLASLGPEGRGEGGDARAMARVKLHFSVRAEVSSQLSPAHTAAATAIADRVEAAVWDSWRLLHPAAPVAVTEDTRLLAREEVARSFTVTFGL